jgi:hypothetical protein
MSDVDEAPAPAIDAGARAALFQAARQKLNDGMDELIEGVARLQQQLESLEASHQAGLCAIKEHVRDESEAFATSAIFISLRLKQLWTVHGTDADSTICTCAYFDVLCVGGHHSACLCGRRPSCIRMHAHPSKLE